MAHKMINQNYLHGGTYKKQTENFKVRGYWAIRKNQKMLLKSNS